LVTAPAYTLPSSVISALTRRVEKTVPEPNLPLTWSPREFRNPSTLLLPVLPDAPDGSP
jgi:hypothetical protein